MSVPSYRRKESKTEFINQLYDLCSVCSTIFINLPKKYKTYYSEQLCKTAYDALSHAVIANTIYLSDTAFHHDYIIRREYFNIARGEIHAVSSLAYLVLNAYENFEGIKKSKKKANKYRELIGNLCRAALTSITSIMKYDIKRLNKFNKARNLPKDYLNANPSVFQGMIPNAAYQAPIIAINPANMQIFPQPMTMAPLHPVEEQNNLTQKPVREMCRIVA